MRIDGRRSSLQVPACLCEVAAADRRRAGRRLVQAGAGADHVAAEADQRRSRRRGEDPAGGAGQRRSASRVAASRPVRRRPARSAGPAGRPPASGAVRGRRPASAPPAAWTSRRARDVCRSAPRLLLRDHGVQPRDHRLPASPAPVRPPGWRSPRRGGRRSRVQTGQPARCVRTASARAGSRSPSAASASSSTLMWSDTRVLRRFGRGEREGARPCHDPAHRTRRPVRPATGDPPLDVPDHASPVPSRSPETGRKRQRHGVSSCRLRPLSGWVEGRASVIGSALGCAAGRASAASPCPARPAGRSSPASRTGPECPPPSQAVGAR